jgi:hypothetical protein
MKKIVLLFLLVASLASFAQKNVVKIGLLGLTYGDYNLSYERALSPQSAINLTAGYWNPNYGFIDFYKNIYVQDGVWIDKRGDIKDGIHFSVDYRFYLADKGALHGLYVAPYLRYWNLSFLLKDEIEGDYFNVDSKVSGIGGGVQLGCHWMISDLISIDWYFFGIGVQKLTGNASWVLTPESATKYTTFDYNTIVDDVNDPFYKVDYVKQNYQYNVTSSAMNVKITPWLPDLKMGLTIGFAF